MFYNFYNFGVSILPLPLPLPLPLTFVGNSLAFTVSALQVTFFFLLFSDNRFFINFALLMALSSFFLATSSASLIFFWFSGLVSKCDSKSFFLGFFDLSPFGISKRTRNFTFLVTGYSSLSK